MAAGWPVGFRITEPSAPIDQAVTEGLDSLTTLPVAGKESARHKYDSLYAAMSVQLDEVTVKANKKSRSEKLKKERGILYNNYDKRLELDSLPYINPNWTINDLVAARSPGIQVIGSRSTVQKFRIRGSNSIQLSTTAQVLVDGAPVTDEYAGSLNIHDGLWILLEDYLPHQFLVHRVPMALSQSTSEKKEII